MDKRRASARITAVTAVFCFVCLIFMARLISLQLINRDKYAPSMADVSYYRETAITAQRGSICDRYGRELVYSEKSYDLVIDFFSIPSDVDKENRLYLELLSMLRGAGYSEILIGDYPLEGTYPDMRYSESGDALKIKEAIISRYKRKSTITAPDLAEYLAERYDLLDKNGNLICTPEEALLIMRLRWSLIDDDFYNTGSYTLAKGIGLELITAIGESGISGCRINTAGVRRYGYPGYASHILGQLGRIYAEDWPAYKALGYSMDAMVGISGCEKIFEDYLRGIDGVLVTEYDKNGYIINRYVKKEPVAGRDVWLTIDIDLQIAAEDGLRDNIDYVKSRATGKLTGEDASAAAFTMVNVKTGQVLAMASYPTYDLTYYNENYNELAAAEVSPLLNRAINGLYAPGSTFKVGVAAAALTDGTISPQTIINDKGAYNYFPDYHPRCWVYISTGVGHGPIDVAEALRVSCNYFFYETGRLLGINKLNEYFSACGLGQPTGFELGGAVGVLAGPAARRAAGQAEWRETDTIVAAIGQSENLFSPLQINMYIAAIANGGTRYASTIFFGVKEFGSGIDEFSVITPLPSTLGDIELSAYHRGILLDAMESVVTTSATLKSMFRGVPVGVGGKTGTAQVGTTRSENALFTAVAPADDPEVAAVCVIEQGHAGSYSAYTVGKVFKTYFSK